MTRRLISLIVMLSFGFFSVETVVADVHDGDAIASEIAAAGAVGGVAATTDQGDRRDDGTAQHTAHVCHCVHSHGGLYAAGFTLSPPPGNHDVAASRDVAAPPKVDRDVHVRPPIA